MTDTSLIVEILQSLQTGQVDLKREVVTMRADLSLQLDTIRQHQLGAYSDAPAQHQALDALRERVDRIERRLQIVE